MVMKLDSAILFLLLVGVCDQYANVAGISHQKLVGSHGKDTINIGVIVDMGSWLGSAVENCIAMAVRDFYNDNSQYKTRISLHIRDSRGDSLHTIAAALDLLENVEVHALIVPVISNEQFFLSSLADKANVPLLSLSAISSLDRHPYYLHIGGDETTEFHAVAALSESFKWKGCVILHESTDDARQVQLNVQNILLENNVTVLYQAQISPSITSDQIVEELRLVTKMKTSVIILHMSPSLASQVFVGAKMLGMMTKGYAWIVTSKTMDLLSIHDSSIHELMQGVIGIRSYLTSSSKLQDFTLRWKTESSMETSVYGVWFYDAVWALALAVERGSVKPYHNGVRCNMFDSACLKVSDSGQALLTEILSSKFTGLAGVFELKNRTLVHETYEIVNVFGNGERRVGFWNSSDGIMRDIYQSSKLSSRSALETIIWPGISLTTPASQLVEISGKSLRVGIPSGRRRPELVSWRHEQETNVTTADGFCIEVFRAAFDWLQLDITFEFFPFSNGTYSDLVHQVSLQNYDVAVGDISILANRSVYVDFTCPYTDLGVGMVAKLDEKDPWFFTRPLDTSLWLLIAVSFVALGLTVWLIEHREDGEFNQVWTLFWFAGSTLVYAHREKLEKNHSRFVVGIWLFVVFILTSSYTANLSSMLTVKRFKLTKSDYIGSSNPLVEGHVVSNLNFDDYRLKPYQTAEDYVEALRKGSKKGGVGAIVDEMPYIKIFLAKYPDEYTIVQTSMTTNGFGFAFPKGSSLAKEVSRAIDALREEGKLLEMEKKWFTRQLPMLSEDSQPPATDALKIHEFSRLFIISAISQMLSLYLYFSTTINGWLIGRYQNFKEWLSIIYVLRALAAQAFVFLHGRFFAHPVGEVEPATFHVG